MFLSTVALAFCLTLPQAIMASINQDVIATNQVSNVTYKEITTDKLPEAVSSMISKDYQGFKIDKAYLGSDGNYKVEISKETMKYSLILSEKGEVIKVEQPAIKKKEQY